MGYKTSLLGSGSTASPFHKAQPQQMSVEEGKTTRLGNHRKCSLVLDRDRDSGPRPLPLVWVACKNLLHIQQKKDRKKTVAWSKSQFLSARLA